MTGNRKRYLWFLIFIMIFLTSCGAREDMTGQYFDIMAEDEQFFSEEDVLNSQLLSIFFTGEEPALLWSERKTDTNGEASLDIWQQQADGRKLLLAQGIDPKYQKAGWYPDGAGCFYLTQSGNIIKVRDTGEELFCTKVQKAVQDLCPLPDGRILVLLQTISGSELAWLEPETGQLSGATNLSVDKDTLNLSWNSESDSLSLLDRQGIVALDITNGDAKRIITFQGTTYMLPQASIKAFRLLDTDRAELLLTNGIKESLRYVDIGKEKNILLFRFGPDEISDSCYCEFFESELVLRDFLQCSQSLCGAVDWETHSCDFSGTLFSKILQVAKRYGYNPKEAYPGLFAARAVSGLMTYDDSSWLESQGQTIVDYFFDDGCRLYSRKQALLAINANSSQKEGAWQFIEFLLKEEAQTRLTAYYYAPVSKTVFEKNAKSQLENGPLTESSDGSFTTVSWSGSSRERLYYQEQKLSQEEIIKRLWRTQEEVDEIRTALERAKPLPLRTMPILEIIYEEASYYFNDVKTLEEVTAIITNRVQLYLDESLL